VSQLRGTVHIESTAAHGTRIEVHLPGDRLRPIEDMPDERLLGPSLLMRDPEVRHG
jgi:hypothetical protein